MKKNLFLFLFFVGMCVLPQQTHAAKLYAVSASQTISVGQDVVVDWYVDTENIPINVVSGDIRFTSDTLQLSSITPAGSPINLWITSPSLSSPGIISFSGGIPSGITGAKILLMRTAFTGIKTGVAAFAIGNDSITLENNGFATKDPLLFTPIQFPIISQ